MSAQFISLGNKTREGEGNDFLCCHTDPSPGTHKHIQHFKAASKLHYKYIPFLKDLWVSLIQYFLHDGYLTEVQEEQ